MSETPFDVFTERLAELDEVAQSRLSPWLKHILRFRQLTDAITWDGLPCTVANHWIDRDRMLDALRAIGATRQADLIDEAIRISTKRQFLKRPAFDYDVVQANPSMAAAFAEAEAAIDEDWVVLWDLAEAYARRRGWTETTSV